MILICSCSAKPYVKNIDTLTDLKLDLEKAQLSRKIFKGLKAAQAALASEFIAYGGTSRNLIYHSDDPPLKTKLIGTALIDSGLSAMGG